MNWPAPVVVKGSVVVTGAVVVTGSVAVDGVSLTVTDVDDTEQTVSVCLMPTTWDLTTLGTAELGACVDIGVDVPAKSVERRPDAENGRR